MPDTFQIKGSKITLGERVSGPPSKMFPLIRDLAERDPNTKAVVAEIDLVGQRVLAQIEAMQPGGTAAGGVILLERPTGPRRPSTTTRRTVRQLDTILAIRVVRLVTIKDGQDFTWTTADYQLPAGAEVTS